MIKVDGLGCRGMVGRGLAAVSLILVSSCGNPDQSSKDLAEGTQSVQVQLVGIQHRQYHKDQCRFTVSASSVTIDTVEFRLEASAGVQARLEPGLWYDIDMSDAGP